MRKLLLAIILIFAAMPAVGSDASNGIAFKDSFSGYKWEHTGNGLAVLTTNRDNYRQTLTIVDVAKKKVVKRIKMPKNRNVTAFDWLADDSGFLMGLEVEPNYDDFFTYTITTGKIRAAHKTAEHLFAEIDDIVVEGKSGMWAAQFRGEGHPDIAVYNRDDATLLFTDVYPGAISTCSWNNGKLICATTAYLELGLTRDERGLDTTNEKYDGRDGNAFYSIDPATKKAELFSMTEDTLLNTSPNGKYVVEVKENNVTPGFTILINQAN